MKIIKILNCVSIVILIKNSYSQQSCINFDTESDCITLSLGLCKWLDDAFKCACASTVVQDIVIVMDSSGSVESDGWLIEKQFVVDLIETAIPVNSSIGIVQFASDDNTQIQYHFTQNQERDVIISNVTAQEYTRGYTWMKLGVSLGIQIFEEEQVNIDRERLMVLITDGNPVPSAQTPCLLVQQLKDAEIRVVIIGVGDKWDPERIDCVVSDPSDIIAVESFSLEAFDAIRNVLDASLCPVEFQIKLSEVKPVEGLDHPVRFIEYYNLESNINLLSVNISLNGIVNGFINASDVFYPNNIDTLQQYNNYVWEKNSYLVLFDGDALVDPECRECLCNLTNSVLCKDAIYIKCGTNSNCHFLDQSSVTVENWYQNATDKSNSLNFVSLSSVVYGQQGDWPKIVDGFTYEVRDIKSCVSDNLGDCWQPSCSIFGTPGDEPIYGCTSSCNTDLCRVNGDVNATCQNGSCVCTTANHYFDRSTTCLLLEFPTNCTVVINKTTCSGPSDFCDGGDVVWSRVDIGALHSSMVKWTSRDLVARESISAVNTRFIFLLGVDIFAGDVSVATRLDANINGTSQENVLSEFTICDIVTGSPTLSPTNPPPKEIPPIDSCNVTLVSSTTDHIDANWSQADPSKVPNPYLPIQGYKLYYIDIRNNSQVLETWSRTDNETTFYENGVSTHDIHNQLTNELQYNFYISAVIYKENTVLDLEPDMFDQATLCNINTPEPTQAPTMKPSLAPTSAPSMVPTNAPTPSPTYPLYIIENCNIYVKAKSSRNREWNATWDEIAPSGVPDERRLILRVGIDIRDTIEINEGSPYYTKNTILSAQNLEHIIPNVSLTVEQKYLTEEMEEVESTKHICNVITAAPTNAPSESPLIRPTSLAPSNIPTFNPSANPTPSPTFYIEVRDCVVILGKFDENNEITSFTVEYTIPDFSGINAPPSDSVRYRLLWDESSNTLFMNVGNKISGDAISIQYFNKPVTINSRFNITIYDKNDDTAYGPDKECVVKTLAPSLSPTPKPVQQPTAPPTYDPPRLFIVGLCEDDSGNVLDSDRCSPCTHNKTDSKCGETSYLRLEDTAWKQWKEANSDRTIKIVKYPIDYPIDIIFNWSFVPYSIRAKYWDPEITINDDELTASDMKPESDFYGGETKLKGKDDSETLSFVFELDNLLSEGKEVGWFKIHNCWLDESDSEYSGYFLTHECSAIYPYEFPFSIINDDETRSNIFEDKNDFPDWIWYLLLGGSVFGLLFGYLWYVNRKNEQLSKEEANQEENDQHIMPTLGPGDMEMDQMNVNPGFNPFAGEAPTVDPASQALINKQNNPEFINPDIQKNVVRDEFI